MSTSAPLLTIIQGPAAILNTPCSESAIIPGALIPEMFRLLHETRGLRLAAPQVGVNARLFVTKWGEVFINPVITRAFQTLYARESCLSFPGKSALKYRHLDITIGNRQYRGIQAIVIQHELDHLNGITIETEDLLIEGEREWVQVNPY